MIDEQKLDYRLDILDERLWLGKNPVPISNKAFQLLKFLVNNPNRLLTKNDILDAVWSDLTPERPPSLTHTPIVGKA